MSQIEMNLYYNAKANNSKPNILKKCKPYFLFYNMIALKCNTLKYAVTVLYHRNNQ
jgi:hypothetical protein